MRATARNAEAPLALESVGTERQVSAYHGSSVQGYYSRLEELPQSLQNALS